MARRNSPSICTAPPSLERMRAGVAAAVTAVASGSVWLIAAHPADAADRNTKGAVAGAGIGLLTGVVEEALLETFTRIQPDAEMR